MCIVQFHLMVRLLMWLIVISSNNCIHLLLVHLLDKGQVWLPVYLLCLYHWRTTTVVLGSRVERYDAKSHHYLQNNRNIQSLFSYYWRFYCKCILSYISFQQLLKTCTYSYGTVNKISSNFSTNSEAYASKL